MSHETGGIEGIAETLQIASALLPQEQTAFALEQLDEARARYEGVLSGSESEVGEDIRTGLAIAAAALNTAAEAMARVVDGTATYLHILGYEGITAAGSAALSASAQAPPARQPALPASFLHAWQTVTAIFREEGIHRRAVNTEEALTLHVIAGLSLSGRQFYAGEVKAYPEQDPRTAQRILDRFEQEGLLTSVKEEASPGGFPRRLFSTTEFGERIIALFHQAGEQDGP